MSCLMLLFSMSTNVETRSMKNTYRLNESNVKVYKQMKDMEWNDTGDYVVRTSCVWVAAWIDACAYCDVDVSRDDRACRILQIGSY